MNKNVIYLAIAVLLGVLLGYFLFHQDDESASTHDHSEVTEQQWTCSMHPQIMQPEPGDCPICGMDLIPASSDAQGLAADEFRMTENATALANIETIIVGENKAGSQDIQLSGKIKANENNISVLVSQFPGRIERLLVKSEGETVKKGQVVAMIYSPELVSAQQELFTAVGLKKSQPELYQAVRNKLKLRKLSDSQIDQIESSGKIQENFPVRADVTGVITKKIINEGDYVALGQVLYNIANLNSVWASFDAYESQIASLKEGQKIKITTNAYPDKAFNVNITFIDPVLNNATRTVEVRAELDNKEGALKPGMFVEGLVQKVEGKATKKIMIPKSAVLWTGKRSLVYVKPDKNQSIFRMKEVTLGNSVGDQYEILRGLNQGDEIVVKGAFTVDAAAQLSGKKSMMNRKEIEIFSEAFQKSFLPVFKTYLELKDGLVATDASVSSEKANQILIQIEKIEIDRSQTKEKIPITKLKEMLSLISMQQDIEKQREYFVTLSKTMVDIAHHMTDFDTDYYVQQCPMANNDKGAVWLSDSKEIRNPYFGERMMACGSVIDSL